jgi:hypothetical protein
VDKKDNIMKKIEEDSLKLANKFGGNVKKLAQPLRLVNGNAGVYEVMFKINSLVVTCEMFKDRVEAWIVKGFFISNKVSFSINYPSHIMGTTVYAENVSKALGVKVYNRIDYINTKELSNFVINNKFSNLLKNMALRSNEFFYIASETAAFTCRGFDIDLLEKRLRCLEQMADSSFHEEDILINMLPDHFNNLKPLLNKWVEFDDVIKEKMLLDASDEEVEQLINVVEPLIPEILKWCDAEREGSNSELTAALENLCEVSTEASARKTKKRGIR